MKKFNALVSIYPDNITHVYKNGYDVEYHGKIAVVQIDLGDGIIGEMIMHHEQWKKLKESQKDLVNTYKEPDKLIYLHLSKEDIDASIDESRMISKTK